MMILRANFLANQFLRQELVANLALEIFKILAALGHLGFQRFHRWQFVLLADCVQAFDDVGVDGESIILGALCEQGLVDQIAQQVLFLRRDCRLNLLQSALRAIILHFALEGGSRVLQIFPRNDVVVHAGDNFLDHSALGLRGAGMLRPEK